jgi:hypothetical protein
VIPVFVFPCACVFLRLVSILFLLFWIFSVPFCWTSVGCAISCTRSFGSSPPLSSSHPEHGRLPASPRLYLRQAQTQPRASLCDMSVERRKTCLPSYPGPFTSYRWLWSASASARSLIVLRVLCLQFPCCSSLRRCFSSRAAAAGRAAACYRTQSRGSGTSSSAARHSTARRPAAAGRARGLRGRRKWRPLRSVERQAARALGRLKAAFIVGPCSHSMRTMLQSSSSRSRASCPLPLPRPPHFSFHPIPNLLLIAAVQSSTAPVATQPFTSDHSMHCALQVCQPGVQRQQRVPVHQ